MKQIKIKLIFAIITIIIATTFSGCDSPTQKVNTAKENVIQAKEDYKTEVDNFKKESNEKITANEKAIADFRIQIVNAKKEVKTANEI